MEEGLEIWATACDVNWEIEILQLGQTQTGWDLGTGWNYLDEFLLVDRRFAVKVAVLSGVSAQRR